MSPTMETLATGVVRPRTTALFFDRLWVPRDILHDYVLDLPREIFIADPITSAKYELAYLHNAGDAEWRKHLEGRVLTGEHQSMFLKHHIPLYRDDHEFQHDDHPFGGAFSYSTKYRDEALREISQLYANQGISLVPVYHDPAEYDRVAGKGATGIEVCLDFIPVPLERKLRWEQVLEVRKDKASRDKLGRLRRWVNTALAASSHPQAVDEIAKQLDDYEWALRKHGIETVLGGVTSVLSCVGGSAISQIISGSTYAALAAGVAVGAGSIAWLGKRLIERATLLRNEVAYIHEVRRLA